MLFGKRQVVLNNKLRELEDSQQEDKRYNVGKLYIIYVMVKEKIEVEN